MAWLFSWNKQFIPIGKILFCFLACISLKGNAQTVLDKKLDGTERGKSLTTLISELEEQDSVRFYFIPEWISPITITRSYEGWTLGEALENLFQGTELDFFVMYPRAMVIIKDPTHAINHKYAIETAVAQKKKVERHVLGEAGKALKQRVTISGSIIDKETRVPIPRVNVQASETNYGTTTDDSGLFSLSVTPGAHVVEVSFVNYETKILDILAYTDGEIHVELEETPTMLQEIIFQDHAAQDLTTAKIGQVQLAIREIKRAPALLGEVDLVRQVQILPGVTTAGEAASGFNVRGGSVDQNLILYDGMPVFNSSHVFGFLSAFNSEAIRSVTFSRGGISAEYGGRASSVLDIQSKDGASDKWNGNAGIGMITSNFMINGPINKRKLSLAASVRSTYSNWLVHAIRSDYGNLSNSSVYFYDGTLKLTQTISDRTKLSFTGYSSKDAFRLIGDSTYYWNNVQGSAKLEHQFSARLTSEFIAGITSYGYRVVNRDYLTASQLSFRISTSVLKAGFNYQTANHQINFGWQFMYYHFNPGSLRPDSPVSNARNFSLDRQFSAENAFYLSDEWAMNDKLLLEAGLRIPMFASFGSASVNIYNDNTQRETTGITDTIHYKPGELIKAYYALEPRLSLRWMATPDASVKFGYNRMYQFLHLVTNTTAVTPVDIWQPSGYYFKPQRADQFSLGYFKDLLGKRYGASAETFYKMVDNILDFKDGAQLVLNENIETDLLQGKGWAYGVETSLSKNTGRLTFSLNYTYSRTMRLIRGTSSSESVNSGEAYPANFDQPHIANVTWKYNLSRRIFFTGHFTYHSGRPVTIPLSVFKLENTTVAYYSGRNQYRIPDYHRLDLALVIEGNNKRRKRVESTWVLSVYNAYARNNPYTVFFKSSDSGIPKPYQLSIVGTIFPSLSYNVRF